MVKNGDGDTLSYIEKQKKSEKRGEEESSRLSPSPKFPKFSPKFQNFQNFSPIPFPPQEKFQKTKIFYQTKKITQIVKIPPMLFFLLITIPPVHQAIYNQ